MGDPGAKVASVMRLPVLQLPSAKSKVEPDETSLLKEAAKQATVRLKDKKYKFAAAVDSLSMGIKN